MHDMSEVTNVGCVKSTRRFGRLAAELLSFPQQLKNYRRYRESALPSQIIEKKARHPLHQQPPRRGVTDSVSSARKRHHFHIFSVLYQLIDQRERIGEMHVVITRAMRDQQFSPK